MREILFRGKRTDNGPWETGSLVIAREDTSGEQVSIADKMTGITPLLFPKLTGLWTFDWVRGAPNFWKQVATFKNEIITENEIEKLLEKYGLPKEVSK